MAKPEPDETEPPFGIPDVGAVRIEPNFARIRQIGQTTLIYGMLGPLIGGLWFPLGSMLSLDTADGMSMFLKDLIDVLVAWAYFSYIFGLIPALTTGVLVGLLPRRWGSFWFVSCAGLIGSLVTVGWLESPSASHSEWGMIGRALLGGVPSWALAAAMSCIPFVGRLIRHRPPIGRPHPNPSA